MDRLTSMTVFAQVATARSFSAAARELGISQATASKHVQMLERWLGSRLLHRTTRRVGLTEAGQSFFSHCMRILEDLEAARQTGQPAIDLRGTLQMTVPVGFGCTRLARLAVAFMAENPQVSLHITVCDRRVDIIEEGYDLAIRVWARPPDDPGVAIHPLLPVPFTVCASPAYLARRGEPQVPADLASLDCLTDSRHPDDVWRFIGPHGETDVSLISRVHADNAILRREIALAGGGILMIPEFMVEDDVAAGRLVRLLPGYLPPRWRLDAVCSVQRAASPKTRHFIAFLTERLGNGESAAALEMAGAERIRSRRPSGAA